MSDYTPLLKQYLREAGCHFDRRGKGTMSFDEFVKSPISRQAREERKVKTLKLLYFSWRPLRLSERYRLIMGRQE
jgi:hypothetical protein